MIRPSIAAASALMLVTQSLPADTGVTETPGSRYGTSYEFAVTPVYQAGVEIDGGGEFQLSSLLLRFGANIPVSRTLTAGLTLSLDYDDYDFSKGPGFGGNNPWSDVHRTGIGVPLFMRPGKSWSFGLTPSVNWLREKGADASESVSWGVSGFAFKSFDRSRSIGLGAGIFEEVDGDTRAFPFVAVDWQFNDRWRLANPFDADALGPAGLELGYRLNDRWRLSGGSVYRSFRFRLDRDGLAPGGIGENKGLVGFARLQRSSPSGARLDFYLGAIVDGELELLDSDGNDLAASDYATAPFGAITLKLEF